MYRAAIKAGGEKKVLSFIQGKHYWLALLETSISEYFKAIFNYISEQWSDEGIILHTQEKNTVDQEIKWFTQIHPFI